MAKQSAGNSDSGVAKNEGEVPVAELPAMWLMLSRE